MKGDTGIKIETSVQWCSIIDHIALTPLVTIDQALVYSQKMASPDFHSLCYVDDITIHLVFFGCPHVLVLQSYIV